MAIQARSRQDEARDLNVLTERTTDALRNVRISVPSMVPMTGRRTSVSLSIPLDEQVAGLARQSPGAFHATGEPTTFNSGGSLQAHFSCGRGLEPIRRDSLKRREALLKGKEGSRRRRRWENDHLLNNPYLQPPLPSDWEVRPTYPRHATVPYNLAPLWDEGGLSRRVAAAAAARQSERRKRQIDNATTGIPAVTGTGTVTSRRTMSKIGGDRATTTTGEAKIKVAKDLRERLKRARAARGTLRDLEEDIRAFIQEWTSPRYGGDRIAGQEMVEEQPDDGELVSLEEEDSLFSEDEEIVYVGRKGQMHGGGPIKETHLTSPGHGILTTGDERDYGSGDLPTDKLVLDTPADDRNASFRRWLVYNIATYYGLRAWSVTVDGNPIRREAYVSINSKGLQAQPYLMGSSSFLPRPLWGLV
ncbi:MAG: hypothetical protein M1815_000186 [Lichina confinis]|nr:MAG: hypothetical protein M1815_000186 [Lichina confinis]